MTTPSTQKVADALSATRELIDTNDGITTMKIRAHLDMNKYMFDRVRTHLLAIGYALVGHDWYPPEKVQDVRDNYEVQRKIINAASQRSWRERRMAMYPDMAMGSDGKLVPRQRGRRGERERMKQRIAALEAEIRTLKGTK